MIYTVIATLSENRIETKNRDCRIIRQPLSLLPAEISEYIENTKNLSVKAERTLAYTTLLCALRAFYSIDGARIERNKYGKPYLADSNIHISLSHSDGSVAVCLSDEGEVGIDIQSEIDERCAERLKNRFFSGFEAKSDDLSVKYYFCSISENEAILQSIDRPKNADDRFTAKWAYAEALMKLHGRGFVDVTALPALAENARVEIVEISLDKKYVIAVSTEK